MRILFNHGLTPGELYTSTPESITHHKWRWWISHYGWAKTYEDSIADPFKYCMGLVLTRVIEDKVRFKIPVNSVAYIDFEIVTGDQFLKHRQNGRFSEIDFIESDFTGYFLNYYFQTKAYQKNIPIYLGGKLKQLFLTGINSGEKYYTTKDITVDDVLDDVQEKFSEITKLELRRLLLHGFRRMHSAIKFGCAISIASVRHINCFAYIGKLTLSPEKQIKEYSIRRDRKLRKIEGWKHTPFDGYYYIGLNTTGFNHWAVENKTTKSVIKFTNIIPRKIKEELYYKSNNIYIFRYKRKTFKGWAFWADSLKVRNLEYLGKAINSQFIQEDKTWKQLIKEYETRSSKHV